MRAALPLLRAPCGVYEGSICPVSPFMSLPGRCFARIPMYVAAGNGILGSHNIRVSNGKAEVV